MTKRRPKTLPSRHSHSTRTDGEHRGNDVSPPAKRAGRKREHKTPEEEEQPPKRQRMKARNDDADAPTNVNSIPLGRARRIPAIETPDVEQSVGTRRGHRGDVGSQDGSGVAAADHRQPHAAASSLNKNISQRLHAGSTHAHSIDTLSRSGDMAGIKRQSNGEPKTIGPHPSTIRVSAPYMTAAAIDRKLQPPPLTDAQDKGQIEAREDSIRLQGVSWLDNTRRALQLPVRTFTTACVYYHKFRLAHPSAEFNWADAAAASLLTSCKVEDTLKKSRDILAMAYNLKAGALEQLGADDALFEAPSRVVIGLERLVLEAGGFDFRSRYPHQLLVKLSRDLVQRGVPIEEAQHAGRLAYTVLTDLHRTFAPLKQTSATMSIAALELAAHLIATTGEGQGAAVRDAVQSFDLRRWASTREEIMETLLDSLDLYTHHTTSSILGQKYSLDDFLRVRLSLNKECGEQGIPRHTAAPEPAAERPVRHNASSVANGHPTPVSPPQTETQQAAAGTAYGTPKDETLRFMLNPQLASDEKQEVQRYFVEEWEEYEEEIEVPNPSSTVRSTSRSPAHSTHSRSHAGERRETDSSRRQGALREERERERERMYERERELERQRARYRERERERDRQYDDRRYDDRRYDRRYDDRRGTRY